MENKENFFKKSNYYMRIVVNLFCCQATASGVCVLREKCV